MTFAMIQLSDVPQVKGDPAAVEAAGTSLRGITSTQCVSHDPGPGITAAWAGLTEDNYHAPEAPAVYQSIPKVSQPLSTIASNMLKMGNALEDAGSALGTLKTKQATLETDVTDFVRRANDMDDFAKAGGSIDGEVWSTWRDAPGLQAENDRLWTRATNLKTEIEQVDTDLVAALSWVSAPDPVLPAAAFTAGVASGNRHSAEGLGASSDAWAGTTTKDGNWYAGAGAEAEAHLFDLKSTASTNTHAGTFGYDAALTGGARADAQANLAVGIDGLHGQAKAHASAGVEGSAKGTWNAGPLSTELGVKGMAGAEADANVGLDVGPNGLGVNAGFTGFAGAKAEVDGSVGLSGAKANVGADVRAGIGIEAKADLKVTTDEVKVSLDFGAALGVGFGVKVDFEIKPKKIVDDIKSLFGF